MPAEHDAPETAGTRLLAGWGATSPTAAHMVSLHDQEAVAAAVKADGHRGTIARGLGRSYGDPAQNAGGIVIDGTTSAGLTAVDISTGVVTAKAGTTIDQ